MATGIGRDEVALRRRRTLVFMDPAADAAKLHWDELGQVVTELSQLYQLVKDSRVDLILVHENRADMTRAVATKVRRFNGLTEIWRLVTSDVTVEPVPGFMDGVLSCELGLECLQERVEHMFHTAELLADFGIVGRSQRMKALAETVERIAPTDMAAMIVGPSGAGKELVARAIHDKSKRADRPFVAVNCGALAEGVLESELFGHEKGAFTGSVGKREGLFHAAEGGTVFLDEIGETTPGMQVRLLRVLEDGTYYPVGSSTPRRADMRLVSATNRDLADAIRDREFREDLFFRIAVAKLDVPPLMERRGDIEPLLQHFWRKQEGLGYSDAALELLLRYDWPGNVRQLRNFAERMAALKGRGLVDVQDVERFLDEQRSRPTNLPVATGRTAEEAGQELIYRAILQLGNEIRMLRDLITSHLPSEPSPTDYSGGKDSGEVMTTMEEMEQRLIEQALAETGGNRKEAARKLGIGERTLYRKLTKFGLN